MADTLNDRMQSFATNSNALATDLIALLDHFIFLEGCTLSTHPVRPETILPSLPKDDTPISVQMSTKPSLTDHLNAHNKDLQDSQTLSTRITALIALPSVALAADSILDKEFAALPLSPKLTFSSLASKLATLRELQQRATQPPRPPEFKTYIVTATNAAGSADPFAIIHLPCTIDWEGYAEVLTQFTRHWKTTADGCPNGYTLKEGKWLYQRIVQQVKEEKFCDLVCEADFRRMRGEMRKEGIGVVVWHVNI